MTNPVFRQQGNYCTFSGMLNNLCFICHKMAFLNFIFLYSNNTHVLVFVNHASKLNLN